MKKMFIIAILAASAVIGFGTKAQAQLSAGIGGPGFSVMLGPGLYGPPPPPPCGYYHRPHRCYNKVWVQGHWIITRRGFRHWIPPHWELV